ncbi:MAG TPA: ATP-dependent DNA ligase [Acidimicrobiia bacterium]|nr:ATP-dependent DNA ligase [Acidimicrobiia bacterium]
MTDFLDLVRTSEDVAATRSRRQKIDHLAAFLAALPADSVAPAVAYLAGIIPQGALGVGWATLKDPPAPAREASLQIDEVVAVFDELVHTSGPGSNRRRRELVERLMGPATEPEQQFLFGLLAGEIRQGALEGIMVDAVARAADVPLDSVRRAIMLDGRIWEVAALALTGGEPALKEVGLTLFRPIRPMLAQSAEDLSSALDRTGPAAVEWKLDGIRIQVHRSGEDVAIYTRNLNPVTDRLDEVVERALGLACSSAVLDGEALTFDPEGLPASFQETAGRFGTDVMEGRGMRAFYFDLLHLDGADLIDEPLTERRRLLEGLVGDDLIPQHITASPEEASGVLADALAHRHEGVMVKALDSRYEAGRRGAAWVKVKPVHTLDLVVLAAEWGHGRRQGWLSNLHLGARSEDGFVMVGKTFKGMTDELLTWQTQRFQEIEERRTRSAVFVRPELVVEIALDGVQRSTRYPGGVALRFARVRGYRPDKDPADADTIDAVREMGGLPPLGG